MGLFGKFDGEFVCPEYELTEHVQERYTEQIQENLNDKI